MRSEHAEVMIFCYIAILSSWRIEFFLGSFVSYQSMLAQWKSDGFIACKCLDRNEDMYYFLLNSYIVLLEDRILFKILCFISKHVSSVEERWAHNP
jgi:hypothetical protein